MDHRLRNRVGFWILGLCNNFGYVVMLSAAHDILSGPSLHKKSTCNTVSTGAILIADIIPGLTIKLISPVLTIGSNTRVFFVVLLNILSFLIVSLSTTPWQAYLGVACASLGSGLGEATFLIHSAIFRDPTTISFWSSGTGGAGVLGSISYLGLIELGVTPKTSLQMMETIPILMAFTFWIILKPPRLEASSVARLVSSSQTETNQTSYQSIAAKSEPPLTLKEKQSLMKNLLPYIIPLVLVYYFEYVINQGLFELISFPDWDLKRAYRWYQADYQIGVFVSRSSVNFVKIRLLWILPIIQLINLGLILGHVLARYLPSFYLMVAIIFWEGLIGGAAYVNTFDQIYNKYDDRRRGFCLGATSMADSLGITLSGFSSVYFHNIMCNIISNKYG